MIANDLYILSLSDEDLKNFAGFGYSATEVISELEGKTEFKLGVIHQYGIFCQPDKTIRIETIKKRKFGLGEHKEYYKMLERLEKNKDYKYYQGSLEGIPNLTRDNVQSPHFF